MRLAASITKGCHAVCRSEIRIEFYGSMEQPERLVDGLPGPLMVARHALQIVVIRVEALRWLAFGALDLGLLQLRCNCANHTHGHPVLQIEDVRKVTVETARPEMCSRDGIHELPRD